MSKKKPIVLHIHIENINITTAQTGVRHKGPLDAETLRAIAGAMTETPIHILRIVDKETAAAKAAYDVEQDPSEKQKWKVLISRWDHIRENMDDVIELLTELHKFSSED